METALLVPAPVAPTLPERDERRPEAARPLHVGWLNLHPDASLNFQLNRWLVYGGESWLADVRPALAGLTGYDAWRGAFLTMGERALSAGRPLDAPRCTCARLSSSWSRVTAARPRCAFSSSPCCAMLMA